MLAQHVLLLTNLLALCSSPAQEAETWTRWQTTLESSRQYANPYADVELRVQYRGPHGEQYNSFGYWDGGDTFRLRFMFPSPGEWRWRTTCSDRQDGGLHNQSGLVHVRKYAGHNPLYDNGTLKVSNNRRYLTHADGTPFLWIADTAWLAYLRATDEEWAAYVEDRQRRGFSVVVISCTCTGGATDEADVGGERPFLSADASCWNPAFWRGFQRKIELANRKGLLVLVAGVAWGRRMQRAQNHLVLAFARNLGARLAGNHVGYSPRQDWGGGREDLLDRAGTEIKRAAPLALVTQHPRRIAGLGAAEPMPDQVLHHYYHLASTDFVSVQTGSGPVSDRVPLDVAVATKATLQWIEALYAEQPHKPVINLEGLYDEDFHNRSKENRLMMVRRAGYYSLLSGAAGYTSSTFGVWAWGKPIRFGPIKDVPGIRKAMSAPYATQLSNMAGFFRSIDWWRLEPRQDLVKSRASGWTRRIVAAASAEGDLAVAYVPDRRELRIDMSSLGTPMTGRWYLPSVNAWRQIEDEISTRNIQRFSLPADTSEAVLVLQQTDSRQSSTPPQHNQHR